MTLFPAAGRLLLILILSVGIIRGVAYSQSADSSDESQQPQSQPAVTDTAKAQSWYLRGDAAERAGNKEEAVRAYLEAAGFYRAVLNRHPDNASLWKRLGFVLWLGDQTDQAMAAYKEAVRLHPDDAEAHHMLGNIQMDDLEASIAAYREAVRLAPDEARYRTDLSQALLQGNKPDAAIEELRAASRINPKDGEICALIGNILKMKGDIDGAISEYQKALTLELSDDLKTRVLQTLSEALKKVEKINPDPDYKFVKIAEWRKFVDQHVPGKSDSAAVLIGSWPIRDLDTVIDLFKEMVDQPFEHLEEMPKVLDRSIPDLLGIKGEGDKNSILKRAALLHTDIAMLGLETASDEAGSKSALIKDGKSVLMDERQHLQFARSLLDSISPHPSQDEMVKQWYIATTADALSNSRRPSARKNLTRALDLFPSDPVILFYAGVLHEVYAAPRVQNALPPQGTMFAYGTKKSELKLAQKYFQDAIAANPDFAEAHMRLGRVLGQLGEHERAIEELQEAAEAMTDPQLLFYVALFLGNEHAMLGHETAAREQFERAAEIFPNAQSPLLALSWLARSSGNNRAALQAVDHVFALQVRDSVPEDPWWEYTLSPIIDADELVENMRKTFGGLPR